MGLVKTSTIYITLLSKSVKITSKPGSRLAPQTFNVHYLFTNISQVFCFLISPGLRTEVKTESVFNPTSKVQNVGIDLLLLQLHL